MNAYCLDPDWRKLWKHGAAIICERCHREIKDSAQAIPVTYDESSMLAWEGHHATKKSQHNTFLGRDCWRKISKTVPHPIPQKGQ